MRHANAVAGVNSRSRLIRDVPQPQPELRRSLACLLQHSATRLVSLGDHAALTEVRDRAGEPELCQELVGVLAESR